MFSCSYTVLKSNSFFKIESLSLRLTRSPEWWRHLRRSQLAISTLRPIRLLIPVIPIRIDRYNCKNVSLALFFCMGIRFYLANSTCASFRMSHISRRLFGFRFRRRDGDPIHLSVEGTEPGLVGIPNAWEAFKLTSFVCLTPHSDPTEIKKKKKI